LLTADLQPLESCRDSSALDGGLGGGSSLGELLEVFGELPK
jgi:hypothetical protein